MTDVCWDRHAIKAEVHRRGLTLVGIARANDLEPSACKVALRRRNYAGERALAEALEMDPAALWPERYRNVTGTSRLQPTRKQGCAASQKGRHLLTRRSA